MLNFIESFALFVTTKLGIFSLLAKFFETQFFRDDVFNILKINVLKMGEKRVFHSVDNQVVINIILYCVDYQ